MDSNVLGTLQSPLVQSGHRQEQEHRTESDAAMSHAGRTVV